MIKALQRDFPGDGQLFRALSSHQRPYENISNQAHGSEEVSKIWHRACKFKMNEKMKTQHVVQSREPSIPIGLSLPTFFLLHDFSVKNGFVQQEMRCVDELHASRGFFAHRQSHKCVVKTCWERWKLKFEGLQRNSSNLPRAWGDANWSGYQRLKQAYPLQGEEVWKELQNSNKWE